MSMNPLGFRSALFQLSENVPMGHVTGELFEKGFDAVEAGGGTNVQRFIHGLTEARAQYAWAQGTAAEGASTSTLAGQFGDVAATLDDVGRIDVSGPAMGHVRSALNAAKDVTKALESGALKADGPITDAHSTRLWGLRNDLDEAWNEIGKAHVLGTLR